MTAETRQRLIDSKPVQVEGETTEDFEERWNWWQNRVGAILRLTAPRPPPREPDPID